MIFAKEAREDVKRKNPEMAPTEIMRELGRRWRETATSEGHRSSASLGVASQP